MISPGISPITNIYLLQQELSMDVLRILGSTDIEVRRKTLDFLMSLISLRNVKDVVSLLKKEVIKTYSNTDKDREFMSCFRECSCGDVCS